MPYAQDFWLYTELRRKLFNSTALKQEEGSSWHG
jgi:hypothetical protein